MKCSEAKIYLSEISDKSINTQIPEQDLAFLFSSGYVSRITQTQYDQEAAEVAKLDQMNQQMQQERGEVSSTSASVEEDQKKIHSYLFSLHGADYKDATREKLEADQKTLAGEEVGLSTVEANISEYIQKKSAMDQQVPYGGEYLSLTSVGVVMLNALNARMSRVQEMDFSDFVQETGATDGELQAIAQRANDYVAGIRARIPMPSDTV
jgi:hypothetical protein